MIMQVPNFTLLRNSALKYKDGHPLSGQGYVQRYKFHNGKLRYDAKPVDINLKNSRGFSEKSTAPPTNFSNTALLKMDDKLYSLFERCPAIELDIQTLETIGQASFGDPFDKFLGVHFEQHVDIFWTFGYFANMLRIMAIRDQKVIFGYNVVLAQDMYVHDFTRIGNELFFPLFPCTFDYFSATLGLKSIVESFEFKQSKAKVLIFNTVTKTHKFVLLEEIEYPIFHIESDKKSQLLHLFRANEFQFETMPKTYKLDSSLLTYDAKNMKQLSSCLTKGEFPSFGKDCLIYAGDSKLVKVNANLQVFEKCISYEGLKVFMDEPKIIDKYIVMTYHSQKNLIFEILTLDKFETVFYKPLNLIAPKGFHGIIYCD